MKQFTLRTVKEDGELVSESTLTVDTEKFILIQKVPSDMGFDDAEIFHNLISKAIEGNGKLITIPSDVELEVLEIK